MSQLAKQYQQKTDKEHILDNPDTYIGSVENVDADLWVYADSDTGNPIQFRNIEYNPGLYKLFDEAIVNASDHKRRMEMAQNENKKPVSYISVSIAPDGTITVENDGNGIDIAKHPENDLWIPEMIFGHLRTSTNYDKDEKRIVGGKNGFGFKLVLIWSTYGYVETVDHTRGLKYCQEFKDNLGQICPPKITKCAGKPYTKVVFKPDYARLKLTGLSADMVQLFKKRTFDIAAIANHSASKKVKVLFNGEQIPVKNFQQYIDMYIGAKADTKRIYETASTEADSRWEYAVALSPTHEFMQVSYVNGICTFKGGKHVEYVMGQICRKLCDYIEKKKKIKVNPSAIKEQIVLFLRCDIENPAFDSQTKDFMNTPSNKFGSTCSVSDGFIEKVAKMGIMDVACSLMEAKDNKLAKKTDGTKTKTIRGIANLEDANLSGGPRSKECTLILCEGLSAMTGVLSGLTSEDRDYFGVFPLRGKLLNVRGEGQAKIAKNEEITGIKKILGLQNDKEYKSMDDVNEHLRYGKVLILTDQDLDGSHIKGLCINLFHSEWPSLLKIPGFISFMNTPILRATKKGQEVVSFYNEGEYETWKQGIEQSAMNSWKVKYYKGLGTSGKAEWEEYFEHKKIVDFIHNGPESDNAVDKVFNKGRADDRKSWLEAYDKTAFLNTARKQVPYEEFIDKEMIHFSTYDCARSIPNMTDGLKTSLRKILFASFKTNLTSEMKVAQFSAVVAKETAYHHGEVSLQGAIVNMAQNYCGSNNINLLNPNGQFGSRNHGGDDHSSPRYIFTELNPITRALFPKADDAVLNYLSDDGQSVEPEYYVPIIPFVLVNGSSGIGTGFSSSIPPYNPTDLVRYLKLKLAGDHSPSVDFVPFYDGFTGTIKKISENKFLIKGKYEKISTDTLRITELPIGTWTSDYKLFVEELVDGTVGKDGKKIAPVLKDCKSNSTDTIVDFTVVFPRGKLAELEATKTTDANGVNAIEKLLKLTTTVSTTNMHLFDDQCRLHKYQSIPEIIDAFYTVRLGLYGKRKTALVAALEKQLTVLSNRAKFIMENLDGTIDLRRKKAAEVNALLSQKKYDKVDDGFSYLTEMHMDSVTEEKVQKILKEKGDAEAELATLRATTLEQMWLQELDGFVKKYEAYRVKRIESQTSTKKTKAKPIAKKGITK